MNIVVNPVFMSKNYFKVVDFHPVMFVPENIPEPDLSQGFDAGQLKDQIWGAGGYNERRPGMYTAPQYKNERYIHMGIDIWAPAGHAVFAVYDGIAAYKADNRETGNYGPTVVLKHIINENNIFALYGHLSRRSLEMISVGQRFQRGEQIGELGNIKENGGWQTHLHYQLSLADPGEADMPGVVSEKEHKKALKNYPDPKRVFGEIIK